MSMWGGRRDYGRRMAPSADGRWLLGRAGACWGTTGHRALPPAFSWRLWQANGRVGELEKSSPSLMQHQPNHYFVGRLVLRGVSLYFISTSAAPPIELCSMTSAQEIDNGRMLPGLMDPLTSYCLSQQAVSLQGPPSEYVAAGLKCS